MIVKCQNYECIYNDGDYCDAGEIIIVEEFEDIEQWVCQTGLRIDKDCFKPQESEGEGNG